MKYDPTKVTVQMGDYNLSVGFSVDAPICIEKQKNRELAIELDLKSVGKIKGVITLDDESTERFDEYLKNKE